MSNLLSFVLLVLVVQLCSAVTQNNSTATEGSVNLDGETAVLSWKLNTDTVIFTLKTTKKVWFGIVVGNGMANTDMAVFQIVNGAVTATDYWSTTIGVPTVDTNQDLTLDSQTVETNGYTVTCTRKLVTGDTAQDLDITKGDLKLSYAYGNTETMTAKHVKAESFTVKFGETYTTSTVDNDAESSGKSLSIIIAMVSVLVLTI